MQLKNDEYKIIGFNSEDESCEGIFISKKALEKWRDHYREVAMKGKDEDGETTWKGWFFLGKRDVIVDILKHFEEE